MAHGAVGGVSSKLQGGKFGAGFFSSAFTKFASGRIQNLKLGDVGQSVVAGVIGGTASVIGGGKFANGAVRAALAYAVNQSLSKTIDQKVVGLSKVIGKGVDNLDRWARRPRFNNYVTPNGQCASESCLIYGGSYDANSDGFQQFDTAQTVSVLRVVSLVTSGYGVAINTTKATYFGIGLAAADDSLSGSVGGTIMASTSVPMARQLSKFLPRPAAELGATIFSLLPVLTGK